MEDTRRDTTGLDDPELEERLLPPEDREDELLQTQDIHTLGDVVDAHSGRDDRDLDVTTRGLDPADLAEEDPLDTVVGYAGNFSNDGMSGDRVDDALSPDFEEPESMMAGEYGPNDSDLTSDMIDNLGSAEEQSPTNDDLEVLSGGVGHVRHGQAMPTGFQTDSLSEPGEAPALRNQPGEPDFARVEEGTDSTTPASSLGMDSAEDEDDVHARDVTFGT